MGADRDPKPRKPTWQIDVRFNDETISFATGPDGAGPKGKGVFWRGGCDSAHYNLADAGVVAQAGNSDLLRILSGSASKLSDSFVKAVRDALEDVAELSEPLSAKPVVERLLAYSRQRERNVTPLDPQEVQTLIANLDEDSSKETRQNPAYASFCSVTALIAPFRV
jgi:hypothetical protein